MTEVAAAPNGQEPVPLDTIPISPSEKPSGGSGEEATDSTSNEIKTVFDDPENFNVKHPLMHEWSLWFTKPPSGKVRPPACDLWYSANEHRVTTGPIC